jgi:4-hydroxy-tetrahydrodipicolinate synthase
MHELCVAAMAGDTARAVEINNRVVPLHAKLFVEPNPVPVKWALTEMGRMPAGLRLPLAPLSASLHDTVRTALIEAGVLSQS